MSAHLRTCRRRRREDDATRRRRARATLHLAVSGSYLHWLHLEADAQTTLVDLDAFLRRTWLECCGHVSDFEIQGVRYGRPGGWMDEDLRTWDVPLGGVLRKGMKFTHTYDYGSTTQCELRVVEADEAPIQKGSLEIIARNDPPVFPCGECGKPAESICTECMWSGDPWLCASCARSHECGIDMLLPVVDSPRVGVCGYAG